MIGSHRSIATLLLSALIPAAYGCSDGGAVNIGNTQKIGAQLSDYAATWDGYAQAFAFSDGTDHVRLTIDSNGHGTLQVGDAAGPPLPTDPHVGYPPASALGTVTSPFPGITGFPYSLHAARIDADRIQVGVDLNEIYSAWRALADAGRCENLLIQTPASQRIPRTAATIAARR